jgi:hypothetical protein
VAEHFARAGPVLVYFAPAAFVPVHFSGVGPSLGHRSLPVYPNERTWMHRSPAEYCKYGKAWRLAKRPRST